METDRQIDRERDRQTDRDRQTETERECRDLRSIILIISPVIRHETRELLGERGPGQGDKITLISYSVPLYLLTRQFSGYSHNSNKTLHIFTIRNKWQHSIVIEYPWLDER